MIRALYTAASGMMIQARKVDVTARNLYFAQTPGYKARRVLQGAQPPTGPSLASDVQPALGGEYLDPSQGALRPTEHPTDLALEGDGFFAVETPGGVGYTRDGRFRRSADGFLINASGHRLLGETGPLQLPPDGTGAGELRVEEDATVRVGARRVGRIRIRHFPGYRGLLAAGGSVLFPTGAVAAQPSQARVVQGALEDANASVVGEMTRTIETVRAFESYQKVIQTVMEDVTGEAARRLGRVA
ncbi:MAG: flagellar basal-body rod protein FlgF [Deferrisomatales bacterium]